MSQAATKTPVILLAFANDDGRSLRQLDEEQKELRQIFRLAEKEKKCLLHVLPAATAVDVIQAFQEYRGQIRIFHYAGHSNEDEIFFKDSYQPQKGVKAGNLAEFLALQQGLELIFLNSCLSLGQAAIYHQAGVKAVIATDREIGDQTAREFAGLFYMSLATGADLTQSFQEAEKGLLVQGEDAFRGLAVRKDDQANSLPWVIYPDQPPSWRLPLVAKHLTRIPAIDLKNEFIGRERDMLRLKDTLEHTSKVVLMNGLGGIGKTVLATAYMQQYGNDYDHLAWINRGEDLITSVAFNEDLADTLGLPFEKEEAQEERFRRIFRELHRMPGSNLLIIDNAHEQVGQKEIYDYLPSAPNWRVLVTSRLNLSGFEHFSLDTLEPDAALKLFRTYYKGNCPDLELEILLQEIGHHTLTVELLAKLLDKLNNLLSVSDLTNLLRQKQLDDPDLQEKIQTNHSGEELGIYLHLMKAFELTKLTDREIWLLKQFIVLPVEQYQVTTLADFLQEKPLPLNKILNSLASKGWLTLHEDKTFSIHRLIRQVVEYQIHPSFVDVEILIDSMIKKMCRDIYSSYVTTTVPWIRYAVSVEHFFTEEKNDKIVGLQNNIASTYRDLGLYAEALHYLQKSLTILELLPDTKHPYLAISYNNIALTYNDLGQSGKALSLHKKSQMVLEGMLDANHPYLAASYNNIALTYIAFGQPGEALCYLQKAIAILEAAMDVNHPNVAILYNNTGVSYRALGQPSEALRYFQKSLAIQETVLNTNHPDMAQTYNNIALTYMTLRQPDEALYYIQKAIAILEPVLDVNHPNLATFFNNLALIYNDLGQSNAALSYFQKSGAILEVVMDANHPTLGQLYNNIGATYCDLGQSDSALYYLQKALAIQEIVLMVNHPDQAQSYNNIAEIYRALGENEEALFYHEKARAIWEAVLNANHPDLATSYNNIAVTYNDLGEFAAALEYHQKALVILETVPAANHPALALCYYNIAETYRSLGQNEEAELYQAKEDAIRKKTDEME